MTIPDIDTSNPVIVPIVDLFFLALAVGEYSKSNRSTHFFLAVGKSPLVVFSGIPFGVSHPFWSCTRKHVLVYMHMIMIHNTYHDNVESYYMGRKMKSKVLSRTPHRQKPRKTACQFLIRLSTKY